VAKVISGTGIGMYRPHLRWLLYSLLLAATLPSSACLFRTRVLDRQYSDRPLKSATQQDLIDYVNAESGKIQSMQATVDIDASSEDLKNGRATDYKEIRGYVLVRKPSMLRMKGLLPLVRNTAFDMVSNGQTFKLWIPPKNKFVIGSSNGDSSEAASTEAGTSNNGPNGADSNKPEKRLEKMRPQYIYEALLIPAISPDEIAVLENGYETVLDAKKHRVEQPDYRLLVVRKGPNGNYLSRRIEFSRIDLRPYRQMIYDEQGNVATDARYLEYKDFSGSSFPGSIEIDRPRENYDLTLTMVKLEINKPLTDDQFVLEQPAGADVVRLGQSNSSTTKAAISPAK
jgi:outer membrane lipoprotein-sorting protein